MDASGQQPQPTPPAQPVHAAPARDVARPGPGAPPPASHEEHPDDEPGYGHGV